MKISINNYEIYILDYIEGNLPLDTREDFDCFLSKNPEIKSEINDFEQILLEPVSVSFSAKGLLKKNPAKDISGLSKFEQLSISMLENDLSKDEFDELNQIITNSALKNEEFKIFQKVKLTPDYSIKYQTKAQLKHHYAYSRSAFYYITGVAASAILLIGSALLYQSQNTEKYAKAISYQTHMKNHITKSAQTNFVVDSPIYSTKSVKTQINPETPLIDSLPVEYINSKQVASIENKKANDLNIEIDEISYNQYPVKSLNDNDYLSFKDFLNKQLREKILKQSASEKVTFASVSKAVTRGLSKLLKKDIKLDEKVMQDGSKLYAFKAGSFEMYTNTKPSKKAEQKQSEKEENKQNMLKD